MVQEKWGELVWSRDHDRTTLSRAAKRGTLRRIVPGLYTAATDSDLANVVRRNLMPILAHELPGAVIADRSADAGGLPIEGELFVVHSRDRALTLPGLTIVPRHGLSALERDVQLPGGVSIASEARTMLESLRRPGGRRLTRAEIEGWIDQLAASGGARRLNSVRDLARRIAPTLHAEAAFKTLSALIAASLQTGPADQVTTARLAARSAGDAYDARRISLFEQLVGRLVERSPGSILELPADADRRATLPFFEAYFSNFIEGTEFTLAEAERIVFRGEVPDDRPDDAHDITGTYGIVADQARRGIIAADSTEFLELLRERHAEVIAARPEKRPGEFKHVDNRAGSTAFVAPDLVTGTLRRAFDVAEALLDPFQRATYMMFAVSEVHPFLDGNGRVARVAMNAELTAGGCVRIVVPTVLRLDYVAALKAGTVHGSFDVLIAVLEFAQRYTARVDFSTLQSAEQVLTATNALRDPYEAEQAGVRLQLP